MGKRATKACLWGAKTQISHVKRYADQVRIRSVHRRKASQNDEYGNFHADADSAEYTHRSA